MLSFFLNEYQSFKTWMIKGSDEKRIESTKMTFIVRATDHRLAYKKKLQNKERAEN